MITHYLGSEEIAAYIRDLVRRLTSLQSDFPTIWVSLGKSGQKLMDRLLLALPEGFLADLKVCAATFDRVNGTMAVGLVEDFKFQSGQKILVIDSAVHSGDGMLMLINELFRRGATDIISYTLVLKRDAKMVPTYFGVLINPKDRMYFDLEELPNNRLGERAPFPTLRELSSSEAPRTIDDVGPPFGEVHTRSLVYDVVAHNSKVYVYDSGGTIAGFIRFKMNGGDVFIDAIATTVKFRGKGLAGPMLRWAETWARSNQCNKLTLWAIADKVSLYERFGFSTIDNNPNDFGDGQNYFAMSRMIDYSVRTTLRLN